MRLLPIPSCHQLADMFTKALPPTFTHPPDPLPPLCLCPLLLLLPLHRQLPRPCQCHLLWLRHPVVAFSDDGRFKVGFTDFVHTVMLVMVFVAISISDYRVTNCLSPREGEFPFDCRDCLQRVGSHLPYFQTWDWLDVVNYVKHVTCRCVVFLFVVSLHCFLCLCENNDQ